MAILIALGSSLPSPAGGRVATLRAALVALEAAGVGIARLSPFYETAAWPDAGDPAFLNAVAAVHTGHPPAVLLTLLHEVETRLGRKRSAPNGPRSLDLDLLDYDGQILDGPLRLPHPRLAARRFVLEPLRAVAPHWRHPLSGLDAEALLAAL